MIKLKRNNYEIFFTEKKDSNSLRNNVIIPKLSHGVEVFVVDENYDGGIIDADGVISNKLNQSFAVKLADCNGVIIMGEKYFAVLHAGWKGLRDGIVENCVRKISSLGEENKNLNVLVGPSIRSCCYEVGEEFQMYFDKNYLEPKGEKFQLNMKFYIEDILNKSGISNIEFYDTCTKCSHNFFSYRNGDLKERFLVGISKIN